MSKKIVLTGSIFVLLGIILGAMAAHALEQRVSSDLIETFEKGVKYQIYIGLGFLTIGLNADKFNFKLNYFYLFNLIGILLFSGCIYGYTFHEMIPILRNAALIVPIGGTAMIIGWTILIIKLAKN